MTKEKTDIVLFETKDKSVSFPVEVTGETVWLSANLKRNTTRKKCVLLE